MKKLKGSAFAKTIAAILFPVLCLCFAAGAAAIGMLYSAGFFTRGTDAARERLAQSDRESRGSTPRTERKT